MESPRPSIAPAPAAFSFFSFQFYLRDEASASSTPKRSELSRNMQLTLSRSALQLPVCIEVIENYKLCAWLWSWSRKIIQEYFSVVKAATRRVRKSSITQLFRIAVRKILLRHRLKFPRWVPSQKSIDYVWGERKASHVLKKSQPSNTNSAGHSQISRKLLSVLLSRGYWPSLECVVVWDDRRAWLEWARDDAGWKWLEEIWFN